MQKWLDLGLPLLSGHLGLVAELGARRSRRHRRLRGQLLQPAHRGGAVPARRAAHHAVGRAHDRRAARRRRAMGGRRLRRAALRPAGGDDDRALRALRRVRSRADDLPRPLRAEAHQRRAHRSGGLSRSRSPPTRPAAIGCCTRGPSRAASSCRGSGAAGSATTTSCSTSSASRSRRSSPAIARCSSSSRRGQRQVPNLARAAVHDAFTRGHFVRAV